MRCGVAGGEGCAAVFWENHAYEVVAVLCKWKSGYSHRYHPSGISGSDKSYRFLERLGATVTYLRVDDFGRVDLEDVRRALRRSTVLISIVHANNIQPLESRQCSPDLGLFGLWVLSPFLSRSVSAYQAVAAPVPRLRLIAT
jgi:hypothetical protein